MLGIVNKIQIVKLINVLLNIQNVLNVRTDFLLIVMGVVKQEIVSKMLIAIKQILLVDVQLKKRLALNVRVIISL